jgi:hypothetical protein
MNSGDAWGRGGGNASSVWGLKGPLKPAGEDGTYPVLISNANSSTVSVNGALDL